MHFDHGQTLASFGPRYANEELCFRDAGGRRGGGGGICLQEGFEPAGSHMLLINGLMDRQQSGVK